MKDWVRFFTLRTNDLIITVNCDIMINRCRGAPGLIVIWAVSTARLAIFPPFFLSFFNKTISNFLIGGIFHFTNQIQIRMT